MSNIRPEATITIPVDLNNPGEFFACCGLLELSHRLTKSGHRALCWFENIDSSCSHFSISAFTDDGPITLEKIIRPIKDCEISTTNPESKEGPVLLGLPFNIILDWRPPFPQNGMIKTFAGQQNLFEIVQTLQKAIQEVDDKKSFDFLLLSIRNQTRKEVTAFGVEKAENVIDAGFSMDDQKGRLFRHPSVFLELLALIGTQRFCPEKGEDRLSRIYYAWQIPLPIYLASIAVSTPMNAVAQKCFVFRMYKRDPQGRYKGFAPSQILSQKKGGTS
jgi:CRISPR-associated protein Csb3